MVAKAAYPPLAADPLGPAPPMTRGLPVGGPRPVVEMLFQHHAQRQVPPGERRRDPGRLELIVAVVISTAGLVTSFASYQAHLWAGSQSLHASKASVHRMAASEAGLEANVRRTMEVGLFTSWMEAKDAGDERLADLYASRFPSPFRQEFDAWLAQRPFERPGVESTPFQSSSSRARITAASDDLDRRADAEYAQSVTALRNSEGFTRATAILALSMFFGGIGQAFANPRVRLGLAITAALACLLGVGLVASLPIQTLH